MNLTKIDISIKGNFIIIYTANNVSGSTFLELDKDELKEIVKQIGTVKQLLNIQKQLTSKVPMYISLYIMYKVCMYLIVTCCV